LCQNQKYIEPPRTTAGFKRKNNY